MADTTMSAGTVSLGVKADATGFGKSLTDEVKSKGAAIGGELGGVVMDGLKMMAGPIAALAAGIGIKHIIDDSVKAFEDLAGSVKSLQRIAGGSVVEVSGLRGAMQLAGVSSDDATGALTRFQAQLGRTAGDASATADMAAKLGTSFTDASGAILPMSQILPGLADKFKDMPNGAEKTALAVDLFGRSGAQLIPFLNKGSDGMAELTQKAKDMGLVLDDTAMNSFTKSKVAARMFAADIQGLKVTLGGDLLPVVESVQNVFRSALTPAIEGVTKFLREHRDEFMHVAEVIEQFAVKVGAIAGPIWATIGNGLMTLFSGAGGAMGGFFQTLMPAFQAVGAMFQQLGPVFAGLLPQIMQLMSAFSPVQLIFKALAPVLPQIIKTVGQLAATLGGALGQALTVLLPVVSNLVTMLVTTLGGVMQKLMPVIVQMIDIIGNVFAQAIQILVPVILQLVEALGPVLGTIFSALMPVFSMLAGLVLQLMQAIAPLIPTVMGLVASLIPLLTPIIQLVGQLLPPLISLFMAIVQPILTLAVGVIQMILVPVLQVVIGVITWLVQHVVPLMVFAMQNLGKIVAAVWQGVADFIKGIFNWIIGMVNGVIDAVNGVIDGPAGDVLQSMGIKVTHLSHIPAMAEGGIVPAGEPGVGRIVRVAEAGQAEAIIPLDKLKDMTGVGGQTVNYYAAPNQSIDSQQALFDAMRRSRLLAGW